MLSLQFKDQFIQYWRSSLFNSSRCYFYSKLKVTFGLENYLLHLQQADRLFISTFTFTQIWRDGQEFHEMNEYVNFVETQQVMNFIICPIVRKEKLYNLGKTIYLFIIYSIHLNKKMINSLKLYHTMWYRTCKRPRSFHNKDF